MLIWYVMFFQGIEVAFFIFILNQTESLRAIKTITNENKAFFFKENYLVV